MTPKKGTMPKDPVAAIDVDALCAEHAALQRERDAMPPRWKAMQADYDRLGERLAQIEQILDACGTKPETTLDQEATP